MNLLEMLQDPKESSALKQLTAGFGINEGDARNALGALVPALARGTQNNLSRQYGLEELPGALTTGQHQRYVDQPGRAAPQQATEEGNAVLGHLLGSKDVSRRVASHAAEQAGAPKAPGGLAGKTAGADIGGLLTQFLDADKDGSVLDDLTGMARKFL